MILTNKEKYEENIMSTVNIDLELNAKKLKEEIDNDRKRLTADRMDISFGEIVNLYKDNELIIRPEYQRLYRWNSTQKTALIESILLAIPIPPIFVSEDENGVWEVIDGLQRITTFISFFGELKDDFSIMPKFEKDGDEYLDYQENLVLFDDLENIENSESNGNKWTLEAGSIIESLEGFNIDSLPTALKINLKRAVCRVEILRGQSNSEMKYELFKRLNSGGSKLTPQEIRNAIYRGIDTRINNLLGELSQNQNFIEMTNLSKRKKSELYDQELVLRFLAYFNQIDDINDNTEIFLNKFMEKTVKSNNYDYEAMRQLFKRTLELIKSKVINYDEVFSNHRNFFVPAFYEGVMIGLAQNINIYENNSELLEQKINELKKDETFKNYSGSASNSKSRIKKRLQRANEIFANQ